MTHRITRREALIWTAVGCQIGTGLLSNPARAQAQYPSRYLNLVVGFSAGGSSDLLARKLANHLSTTLGQSVVILNKDGAGSTIAVRYVADAEPDGYTVLLGGSSGMVIAPVLQKQSYDPIADFKTIAMIARASSAIGVHPSVPAQTLPELIALLKANPGKYSFASAGMGGFDHLTSELFKQVGGDLDILHVPYRGGAAAVQSVISGVTPMLITTLAPMYPYAEAGSLRIIATTGPVRSSGAPEIPTAVEQGVAELVAETANFISVPSKIPPAAIEKLKSAMKLVMANPVFQSELRKLQFEPTPDFGADATEQFVQSETEKWRRIAVRAKLI